jgi:hypothetical protein
MKNEFLICLVLVFAAPSIIVGQSTDPFAGVQAPAPTASPDRMQPRSPDQMVEFLGTRLSLTDDQKARIKPILAECQKSLMALRNDSNGHPRARAEKMREINETFNKRMKAVLDEAQMDKFTALEEQLRDNRRDRNQQPVLHRADDQPPVLHRPAGQTPAQSPAQSGSQPPTPEPTPDSSQATPQNH